MQLMLQIFVNTQWYRVPGAWHQLPPSISYGVYVGVGGYWWGCGGIRGWGAKESEFTDDELQSVTTLYCFFLIGVD